MFLPSNIELGIPNPPIFKASDCSFINLALEIFFALNAFFAALYFLAALIIFELFAANNVIPPTPKLTELKAAACIIIDVNIPANCPVEPDLVAYTSASSSISIRLKVISSVKPSAKDSQNPTAFLTSGCFVA